MWPLISSSNSRLFHEGYTTWGAWNHLYIWTKAHKIVSKYFFFLLNLLFKRLRGTVPLFCLEAANIQPLQSPSNLKMGTYKDPLITLPLKLFRCEFLSVQQFVLKNPYRTLLLYSWWNWLYYYISAMTKWFFFSFSIWTLSKSSD